MLNSPETCRYISMPGKTHISMPGKNTKNFFFLLSIRSTKSGLRLMGLCLIDADLSEFSKSAKYLRIGLIVFDLFDLKVDIAFCFS